MTNRRYTVLVLAAVLAASTVVACDALSGHRDVVAQAGGHQLTIEKAAQMLAAAPPRVAPADAEVAQRFASIWTEYTLLALEMASRDSIEDLPLDRILERPLHQELLWQLRKTEILPRVDITDADLRAAYDSQQPGARFHAAHILLRLPQDTAAQDSVRRLAESLRQRAAAGADFAALARRHSADPGSAPGGGDLGWFNRGQMVEEFEAALNALEPGDVSPVVQTRFGLHIIKLIDRERPPLEQVAERFRNELEQSRVQELEDAYIDSVTAAADVEIRPEAIATAREIARAGPYAPVSAPRRKEKLATYRGGALTVDDFLRFLHAVPQQTHQFFAQGTDEQVEFGIQRLVQDRLLVQAARDRGLELDTAVADSLARLARQQVQSAARMAGFAHAPLAAADTLIDRQVEQLLAAALQGRRPVGPLGPLGQALRDRHATRVYPERFPDVALRVQAIRAAQDSAAAAKPVEPPTDTASTTERSQ